jgi:L-ascorbate 6-phosphate lactonase
MMTAIMDGFTMGTAQDDREICCRRSSEWGSYLNEEIDQFKVKLGTGALVFRGPSCLVTGGGRLTVDLYFASMFTDYSYCGVCRTSGADKLWWIRINPQVIDPRKFKRLDAVCVTHHHQDHLDFYTISAALQTT